MRVALIQFNASAQKADNLEKAKGFVEEALNKGASFVLLPEIFYWRGNTRDTNALSEIAEPIPGPTTAIMSALAVKHRSFILIGSIFERGQSKTKFYNTSILINDKGSIIAKYRKIHLFDARIGDKILKESDCFVAGKDPVQTTINEFKMGLSICYDLRFPSLYATYGLKGAHILTVPSCFTKKTGQAHWESLLRARAIENLAYVLAPNQVGADYRGIEAYGNSMIISPWGEVLARASESGEEIIYGDIDQKVIDEARRILPGIIPAKG